MNLTNGQPAGTVRPAWRAICAQCHRTITFLTPKPHDQPEDYLRSLQWHHIHELGQGRWICDTCHHHDTLHAHTTAALTRLALDIHHRPIPVELDEFSERIRKIAQMDPGFNLKHMAGAIRDPARSDAPTPPDRPGSPGSTAAAASAPEPAP